MNLNLKSSNEFNFGYGDFTIDYWVSKKEREIEMIEHPFIKKIKCHHCNGTGEVKNGKICIRCRGTGYWLHSLDEKIATICKSCRGTGFKNDQHNYDRIVCNDCHGFGYTDWLEKVIPNKKENLWNIKHNKPTLNGDWKIIMEPQLSMHFNCDMMSKITKDLAKQLANDIDREILSKMLGNHYPNLEQI